MLETREDEPLQGTGTGFGGVQTGSRLLVGIWVLLLFWCRSGLVSEQRRLPCI